MRAARRIRVWELGGCLDCVTEVSVAGVEADDARALIPTGHRNCLAGGRKGRSVLDVVWQCKEDVGVLWSSSESLRSRVKEKPELGGKTRAG